MKSILRCIGLLTVVAFAVPAGAQQAEKLPTSLGELLQKVKNGWREQSQENKKREAEFLAAKNKQAKLLKQAQATLKKLQARSEALEKQFNNNEAELPKLEETLKIRLGTMGEMFGVIRQVAGDTRTQLENSLISAQLPGRGKQLAPLTHSRTLPSIKQLETMWYLLQQQMIESGKVVRFKTNVVTADGDEKMLDVIRVGPFNAVANNRYLNWMPDVHKLVALARQPSRRYLTTVEDLEQAKKGYVRFAVDPSRGSLLSLLVQTPTFWEQIDFGGLIGYIIIVLGLATLALALLRLLILGFVSLKVRRQKSRKEAKPNNPLGRILGIYSKNPNMDTETLETKLDEAIMRETAKMDRFLWAVKIVSVVSPLLGLLGTITGMIKTFQAITLFGTGDPKLMAGGISEALVTTMLGLMVAIPLVLLHSWMKSISRGVIEVLEEQSTGILAQRREELCRVDPAE